MVKVEPKRGLKVDLFTADRLGTNGHPSAKPSRMTYMAHAKGYVNVPSPWRRAIRRQRKGLGCIPALEG